MRPARGGAKTLASVPKAHVWGLVLATVWSFGGGAALSPSVAQANAPTVVLLPAGHLPPALRSGLVGTVRRQATLGRTSEYRRAAARKRLGPTSKRALTQVGPALGVSVVMIARYEEVQRVLHVTLRAGPEGSVTSSRSYRLRTPRYSAQLENGVGQQLRAAISRARVLSTSSARANRQRPSRRRRPLRAASAPKGDRFTSPEGEAESPPSAPTDDDGLGAPLFAQFGAETEDGSEDAPAHGGGTRAAPNHRAGDEEDEPQSSDHESVDIDEGKESEALTEGEERDPAGVIMTGGVGFGVGMRAVSLPTETGPIRLSTTPFPVAGASLGLDVGLDRERTLELGAGLAYATSIGLKMRDVQANGMAHTIDARTQRAVLEARGAWAIQGHIHGPRLLLGAGYSLRTLSSDDVTALPSYTLSGPHVRLGVAFTVAGGSIALRLGVEGALVMSVTESLEEAGTEGSGLAAGGEASVSLALFPDLEVGIAFRESHAWLGTTGEDSMDDVERLILLQARYAP